MGVLDLFFPKRCVGCRVLGSYICSSCFSKLSFSDRYLCFVCNRASLNGLTHPICKKPFTIDGVYSSLVYAGVVKRLVYQFKYQPYVTDLQNILGELFYEGIIQHEIVAKALTEKPLLVPIPLFAAKERKRGYNQAEILAQALGQMANSDVRSILVRVKKTESQFALDREKRQKNMQGAFVLGDKEKDTISGKIIFLIDDVVTSGATLIEAAKVLKRNGAGKVYGVTLAHGQ